ncbi:MAG: type II secretion system protein [Sumerlaeia bacterium]
MAPKRLSQFARGRLAGFSLIEVLIAVSIVAIVVISAIFSVIFYQRASTRNDRLAQVSRFMEARMEDIRNRSWFDLIEVMDPDPNNERSGDFPAPGADPERYEATALRFEFLPGQDLLDGDTDRAGYSGMLGRSRVFYTPLQTTHTATNPEGRTLAYDVRYYKVEVVVELDEGNRARLSIDGPNGLDTYALITYISELNGRGQAQYLQRTIGALEARGRIVE